MCVASAKGTPGGKAPFCKVSVLQQNLLVMCWTCKSAMPMGHLVGKGPRLHVTVTSPVSEIWRDRLESNAALVLENESPYLHFRLSRPLLKG